MRSGRSGSYRYSAVCTDVPASVQPGLVGAAAGAFMGDSYDRLRLHMLAALLDRRCVLVIQHVEQAFPPSIPAHATTPTKNLAMLPPMRCARGATRQ
jgi:hypothetical protein